MAQSLSRRSLLSLLGGGIAGAVGGAALANRLSATQANAPLPILPDTVQVAPVTITTTSSLRVHAVQTGFVAVKAAHRELVPPDDLRLMAILLDTQWVDWMPIMTWVIEHPEGTIVVDSGETSQAMNPEYFNCDPVTQMIYRSNLRFSVTPADEIGAQLRTLDIEPLDVRWLVQTHLHSDHVGGMNAFENADVYLPQADYPMSAGTLTCHYPSWFAPRFADFREHSIGSFTRSMPLTQAGDVWIVPTPGHSMGHQSVLLRDDGVDYLFAGDTSFDQAQMQNGGVGGIVADVGLARETLATVREYAAENPLVYLPTHDPDSRERFATAVPVT